MTPEQCRMARAALKWSGADLAREAGVGYATVARYEAGSPVQPESVERMLTALQAGGIELIPAGATIRQGGGGAGPGVRLTS